MDDDQNSIDGEMEENAVSPRKDFFGSYTHGIDAKGRLIIPNPYRAALGSVFTIGPTRDFQGVALYPEDVYTSILAELSSMNPRNPDVQKYTRQFYKLSYRDIQADGQGRILLPPGIRQRMLEDAKDLEISGAFDHVRIVDATKANEDDRIFTQHLDQILENIGNMDPR